VFFIHRGSLAKMIKWIVVLHISMTATQGHTETLYMAIGEWAPYAVFDSKGKSSGIAVDKAHRIFAEMDLKLVILQFPIKRALKMAENGSVDGLLMSSAEPKRARYLAFSHPIFCDRRFLYVRKGHAFDWHDRAELQGKSMGVGLGFYYGKTVQTWIADGTIETIEANNTLSLFKMIIQNRVDVIAFSEREADIFLNQYSSIALNVERLEQPVSSLELHLGFSLSRRGQNQALLSNNVIEQLNLEEQCE